MVCMGHVGVQPRGHQGAILKSADNLGLEPW